MGTRREAREAAVQFLYQVDLHHPGSLPDALREFWKQTDKTPAVQEFAEGLIHGVLEHSTDLDARIRALAENWDFTRLAIVDRNVLRLAIYEMLHRLDTPPVVAINEAIEIAKKFSSAESGKFVNGLLDRVRQDVLRPGR